MSPVHSIVKRKVTVFLQYFCHNVLHSRCCGGHCSLLPLFCTKELVDFLLSRANWVQAMVLIHAHCSNKRCACSNKRIIYKKKKIGSFIFSRNCSNNRFALYTDALLTGFHCIAFDKSFYNGDVAVEIFLYITFLIYKKSLHSKVMHNQA